jgi:hypothetical protein
VGAPLAYLAEPATTAPADALLAWADRHRVPLLAGVVLTLLVGFNGQWRIEPDSALYMGLARNLARGQGFTYHGATHRLVYPGFPLALSVLFRCFPAHPVAAADALALAAGAAALALTFRLLRLAIDRPTAVVVTLGVGLSHEFYTFCLQVMPECPFLAGAMALLAGHEAISRRPRATAVDWALLVAGAIVVITTKPMTIALVPASVVTLPWRGRHRRRAAVAAAILIGLMAAFWAVDPRRPFSPAAAASYEQLAAREAGRVPGRWPAGVVANVADLLGASVARTLVGLPMGTPLVGALFAVPVLAGTLGLWRFRPLWGAWATATLAKSVLLLSHDRYLVPILPLLVQGEWRALRWGAARLPARAAIGVVTAALVAVLGVNLVMTGVTAAEQHASPLLSAYHGGRLCGLAEMGSVVANATPADAVLVAPATTAREFTFLSGAMCTSPPPRHRVPAT